MLFIGSLALKVNLNTKNRRLDCGYPREYKCYQPGYSWRSVSVAAEGQRRRVEGRYGALIFLFSKGKNEPTDVDRISRGLLYHLKMIKITNSKLKSNTVIFKH